jgi:hypothetical protein
MATRMEALPMTEAAFRAMSGPLPGMGGVT